MRSTSCDRRGGFTLVEMLVVMSALGLLVLMVTVAMWTTVRIERVDAARFNRLLRQSALADRFRSDVAGAEQVLEKWQDFQAGPDCLILRQGVDRHVVYRWDRKRLARLTFDKDRKTDEDLHAGLDIEDLTVAFERSGPRLCVLRLTGPVLPGSTRPSVALALAAALGGERR